MGVGHAHDADEKPVQSPPPTPMLPLGNGTPPHQNRYWQWLAHESIAAPRHCAHPLHQPYVQSMPSHPAELQALDAQLAIAQLSAGIPNPAG